MKVYFISLFLFLSTNICSAQILKELGKKIKDDAEWRVRNKADQQISKGLDSLIKVPKKINEKKKSKENKTDNRGNEKQDNNSIQSSSNTSKNTTPNNSLKASANNDIDMTPKDGFINLKLSAVKIFAGGSLTITGESIKVRNFKDVEITVTGPSTKDVKSIPLAADGKYITVWTANDRAGEYTVTAKGSDKKSSQSAKFTVYTLPQMSNWADENINLTNKAYDKLKDAVAKAEGKINGKNKAELDKKMGELKDKVDYLLKLYKDLNIAGKQTADIAKSDKNLPPNLAGNLSDLNNNLADQALQMKIVDKIADHEPQDNTICEYLVMVNEACAAFSTASNGVGKGMLGILKNIALDKGVPKTVEVMNNNRLPSTVEWGGKESAKIFATSLLDAESLQSLLGKAGFAGDILQFVTEVLLKIYCGIYKGSFTHNYNIIFRNAKGQTWWSYGVEMKAALSLRYPKEGASGNIIKMKGNLEGNATKFSFFEDVEKEDGFQEGSKGKIEVVPIKAYTPFSVSFATSEKDVLGFGAIARGLATPAYFNIPLDAEYDVDEDKIKLFIRNEALVDFTPLVANQFVFLLIGGDLLPYIKWMTFPIHPAATTIGSVVRSNNEFEVERDSKGNPSFNGKANKHLGSPASAIEHDLNFTISATKQ